MTHQAPWQSQSHDRAFFERELASFVPDSIYDAHVHAWPDGALSLDGAPRSATHAEYQRLIRALHPHSSVEALIIPFPAPREMIEPSNDWVAREVEAAGANTRGLLLVRPDDDPEWVREQVRRRRLHGLKCYHRYAAIEPTWDAQIPDYLPEPLVKVADEEGWIITLHLVRPRGVADAGNIHWIRHYCRRYPNIKLILAHSARGFQPSHNFEGLPQLRGLGNLYFDSSANCEAMAHLAILRIMGHDRLLYGSDFPVSHLRGRSVAADDSFLWLYEQTPVWGEKHARIDPVLVGLEHLRSLKWACWAERLTDAQIEAVFAGNAMKLFEVGSASAGPGAVLPSPSLC
jgi:glutamate-1-semialdehyde 2,1-aminomutase